MSAIIPVFIPHVGCPHDCVFCNQKKIAGTLAAPTGEEVGKIIENALAYSGNMPQVAFYGGSFTAIDRPLMLEYLESAKAFIDSGKISSIRLSTRPDCIDEEILDILREFGVETIELGCQSMVESVLLASGRGHTAEDVRCASRLIKARGFRLVLQMMTHLPSSDNEKDIETARELCALCPDGVRVYPTVVVRDTVLEVLWRRGEYIAATPEEAAELGGEIIGIFEENSIPIIRFGLNPTDDLSSGEALAGAYHPALGEMALSAKYLRLCERKLDGAETKGKKLLISVNKKRISAMSGQKKANKKKLLEKYGFSDVSVCGSDKIADGDILIEIALEKTGNPW